MKIITKDGINLKYEGKCNICYCEFICDIDDIERNRDGVPWTKCPHCQSSVILVSIKPTNK